MRNFNLTKVEKLINQSARTPEEKQELWNIVEEIVHHSVMHCILDNLPSEHHEEFLGKFPVTSFDDELIKYLEEKSGKKITEEIEKTIQRIETEILKEIN